MQYYSFRFEAPSLAGAQFLFARHGIDSSGDLETEFFAQSGPVTCHRCAHVGRLAVTVAANPDLTVIVISRNPALVLDPKLTDRIAAAMTALEPLAGFWSLAAAGGLTASGGRVCALYNSETPFIPTQISPQPITDPLPDLYLVDAAWLRSVATRNSHLPDAGFEVVLANQGFLEGRVALFSPELIAGVNGALQARDLAKLRLDLQDWFGGVLPGAEIPTLMGPVKIEPPIADRDDLRAPWSSAELAEAIDLAIIRHCRQLSLSIVVRTQFERSHLLDRLLTSITRARGDGDEIEIVLSSDASHELSNAEIDRLQKKFVNLNLRLRHNLSKGHSRVTNLVAGLHATTCDHVVILDDDDYVDLFAFDIMRRARFLGACPLMIANSQVHEEKWIKTPTGRHILAQSIDRTTYPAGGWRDMFGGVNRLPICAMIIPRKTLIDRLDAFSFRHELSEDYALFLLILTDPALPEIVELSCTFGHVSLRLDDGHSVTMEDRRPWTRDIALYLADLTRSPIVAGPGLWANFTQGRAPDESLDRKTIADLRAALADQERQIRWLARENEQLRADTSAVYVPVTKPALGNDETGSTT